MTAQQLLEYSTPFIQKIFPEFAPSWVVKCHLWKEQYSQPLIVKDYSKILLETQSQIERLHVSSMAQVYPEDRGTNYAVREGRKIGRKLSSRL